MIKNGTKTQEIALEGLLQAPLRLAHVLLRLRQHLLLAVGAHAPSIMFPCTPVCPDLAFCLLFQARAVQKAQLFFS